jgi:CheY-like chemotaxis protein
VPEKKSILIVDDSQVYLLNLCTLMGRMGFGIIPAESGLEAMKLLKINAPDLVLLDVNMPMVDGIKTLQHIKDTKPNIPVVMLSDVNNSAMAARCRELGCSDYLHKPFNVRELHGVLQEWIYHPAGWKRKNLRVNIAATVHVLYNGMLYGLMSETLSEGGMYVKMEMPLPVGSRARVTLEVRNGKVLILDGHVIYTRGFKNYETDISPGMAIEFTDMKDDDAAELSQYVVSLVNENLTFN